MSRSLVSEAEAILRLSQEEPERATGLAQELRARAIDGADAVVESMALRALGLAARVRAEISDAVRWLEAAVATAAAAGDLDVEAEARVSLSSALAYAGESVRALEVLDGARPGPKVANIVASDRAGILTLLGRYDEASQAFGPIIESFRLTGDRRREAQALVHRAIVSVYTGHYSAADADLERAQDLFDGLQLFTEAATAVHNQAFSATRRGDLPRALDLFERAESRYLSVGVPGGALALDRAEALLAAGLVDDARASVLRAIEYLRAQGSRLSLADGLVLAADAALAAGDPDASAEAAGEAAALFKEQDRATWTALAQAVVARSALATILDQRLAGAGPVAGHPIEVGELASAAALQLQHAGLQAQAVDAHATAGELWLLAGRQDRAGADLAAASAGRRLGTARARAAGWEAEGVRRLAAGDRRGAMSALRSSLRTVADHQASLGASELRSSVAVHAERTAGRGLRLALEGRRPREILAWMERRRGSATLSPPLRPPLGEPLAGWLDEMRTLAHEIQGGATSGADVRDLLRRQARLERAVRSGSWSARGRVEAQPRSRNPADMTARIVEALGERALVELTALDGTLHAVAVAGRRSWYRPLGPVAAVHAALEHTRFSLRTAAFGMAATGGGLAGDAAALDDLVLGPLRRLIGDRPLVVVPTGALHAAPWGALPTLARRAVTVAPSARAWLRAAGAVPNPGAPGRVLVVAGPGLPGARAEADSLQRLYPGATVLSGGAARSATVLAGLQSCDTAHVAAHATFRADNGLWSSLHLDDGPLSVYEMEDLPQAPALVVLSACQSGLSAVRPGDEVLGLVAGLLAVGTRTVVASVVPVGDGATTPLMVDLHRRLAAGDEPGAALAGARGAASDPAGAASFVCFGAG